MLDFVGGCCSRKAEMLLPTHRWVGEIGVNVGAVEHVAGAAGIENSIRRYGKSREFPNDARVVVPDQASLTERHPTNPAASALEIIKHCCRLMAHLLAEAFGDDRHVDVAKKVIGVRSQSSTIEGGENSFLAA